MKYTHTYYNSKRGNLSIIYTAKMTISMKKYISIGIVTYIFISIIIIILNISYK